MNDIRNSKGFTMIELVISILIFALGSLGVAKLQQSAIMGNSFSMQMTNTLNIVDSQVEYLRGVNLDHADLTLGTHNGGTTSHQGVDYTLAWTVNTTALGSSVNTREVQIVVSWMEKNTNHSVTTNLMRSTTQ
jgi:prepilin-type N-terminal cleavage/methylation domain-containing protein